MTSLSDTSLAGVSFHAVIFDLDGTLINSHVAMIRSYERWAAEFGISLDKLSALLGMPSSAVSEALLPAASVELGARRIEELEVADTEGVVALPGAMDAFDQLAGCRVAIATSCTAPLLRARLSASGLPFPDVIVTRDQVTEGKPAPDSFLLAAERLGVDPSRVLVVEDAPAGIAAARAAGCAVLGIASTKAFHELEADAVVKDLSEVRWIQADDGTVSLRDSQ